MRKQSVMGSSKYEFNPNQFDQDLNDRREFYSNIKKEWDKIDLPLRELYEKLLSFESYQCSKEKFHKKSYGFNLTHEGYKWEALEYCKKLINN